MFLYQPDFVLKREILFQFPRRSDRLSLRLEVLNQLKSKQVSSRSQWLIAMLTSSIIATESSIYGILDTFYGISTIGVYLRPNRVYTIFLNEQFVGNIFKTI